MGEQAKAVAADEPDTAAVLSEIAGRSQKLMHDFMERQQLLEPAPPGMDPLGLGSAMVELGARLWSSPAEVMSAQFSLWQDYLRLWNSTTSRLLGGEPEAVVVPERGDRRFKDAAWEENPVFDFIKQSYLLTSRFLLKTVSEADGLDEKTQAKLAFYTRQFVDALAPSNFVATNPQVLRETIDTKGENLLKGLSHLLEDLERGKGRLSIKMTDLEAFEVGRNIATTPGKVVYQNDLMQLIQYEPTTEKQYKRPLLIVPPWINKFYILDLQPKNSFIKYCCDQGFTTFVVSWVNPDAKLAHKSFEDYMRDGILAALDAIEQAVGEKAVNAIGYCLGGTLMASTLAYMATKRDSRIKAVTFFTTLVDFKQPGELGVFIDEEQLKAIEAQMSRTGYLEGAEMAHTFNMLRANDLIWSFVVNNYLLGKEPFPFDLLYWNSDSTRMPATMHSFYLRKFYHENKLVEPGGISLCGVPIDLRKVKLPVYWVSTREDHIAPWQSTYAATRIYQGPKRFVLAGSGHIAGVVNPPHSGKYGYWVNDELPPDPADWLAGATEHPGSWWDDWRDWLKPKSGALVAARVPGEGGLPALEDAPGSYAKIRADTAPASPADPSA
ncbi:MAG TPA: class I poly(R)-hydroxyalkanoic acid synthase [Geminicoccus sp.]|uniref:PHA/PHB synthase family protein n=1 Tax=Geminicoccus sp. TaxID=2024832 RepID=UPI002CDAE294|nr:class I poly(R)-hydroxyalkanoic acid synthase [Geminicoccus sp.]HWL70827.1 class I poly(R)-hydroxyalkanoic acid synthase [Geminicoccus sp.]